MPQVRSDLSEFGIDHPSAIPDAFEDLSSRPLGSVTAIQALITEYARDKNSLAPLFEGGEARLPASSSVGAALAFLDPDNTSSQVRRNARRHQLQILQTQAQWPDLAATTTHAHLLCSDMHSAEGLPPQIYQEPSKDRLALWASFHKLVLDLVEYTSGGSIASPTGLKEGQQAALTTVLFELFKNTEDHAKHDVDGSDIRGSIRGIHVQYFDKRSLSQLLGEQNSPAAAYCQSVVSPKAARGGRTVGTGLGASGVIEVSIFDSGPGMAARWLRADVTQASPQNQKAAVLACFQKGQTSTASPTRGFGLWKVLRSVEDLRGLIQVRTNSVHAYRRFDSNIYRQANQVHARPGERQSPIEDLLDWRRGVTTSPSSYVPTRGTVVSMLFPVA